MSKKDNKTGFIVGQKVKGKSGAIYTVTKVNPLWIRGRSGREYRSNNPLGYRALTPLEELL